MTASHIASSILSSVLSRRMPALLTSTSTLPERVDRGLDDARRALAVATLS